MGLCCACSCLPPDNETKPYYREVPGKEPTRDTFYEIIEFEHKGHEYIWFRSLNGGYAGWDGGIVHNPDCKYCKSQIMI